MRSFVMAFALAAAACGGGSKSSTGPVTPGDTAPAATSRLELGEIGISESGQGLFVHTNGTVEVVDGADRKPLGTLTADGKFTLPDGDTGQLNDDGSFTTKEGPAPFRLEDETLVVGDTRLTLDANSVIQGGKADMSSVKITGVTSRGTRRTALLMIGFLTLAK
jgi:hypothetical protein